jgi:hypothetical protein
MDAEISVSIGIDGLPDDMPALLTRLRSSLQEEVEAAIGRSLDNTYENGIQDKDWTVRLSVIRPRL